MVARLKLKEIDGRAPPGVNLVRLSKQLTLRLKAARKGDVVSPDSHNASPSCTDLRILRRRAVFDTAPPGGGYFTASGPHIQIAGTSCNCLLPSRHP